MSEPPDLRFDPRELPPVQSPTGPVAPAGGPGVPAADAPVASPYLPREEQPHLRDYWRVVVRHRWTVAAVFLVTVVTTAVWVFTTRPVYTGVATLRIEREEPRVVKFEEVVKADPQEDYYQTQYRMLQSRTLASRVIGLLALDQHPEFTAQEETGWLTRARARLRQQVVRWMPVPPPPPPEAADDLVLESPLVRAFQARLRVQPVRGTRLVNVSFESHYPDLAARVPNALVEAFIAQSLDQKVEATRYASQFLARQMEETRGKLEASEERLAQFLQANGILFLGAEKTEGQDLVTKQLAVLSDALLRARAERIAKESLLTQALAGTHEALPAVLQSPLVARLRAEEARLEAEYRELGRTFKPDYPRMQRLAESLAEVRRQVADESRRVVEALDADYRVAVRTEQELEKAVDAHRGLAQRLGAQMAEYNILRREVDANRELYLSLLTRLKETSVTASLLVSNISVVDRAEVPASPSRPRRSRSLVLAVLVGLAAGVGFAFFLEYLDTTIKDAREVETVLRVPAIGVVPSRESVERRRTRRLRPAEEGAEPPPFALVAHAEAASALAESFRGLRTSLLYSAPDHPPRTLLVTSLAAGDGKTSLATNLAIVLAQLGAGQVLLVDGDLRRPRLHELLEVPQAPGLSTFLTGHAELDAVIRPTGVPNLSVIPSGQVPLNPTELMASARLRRALDALTARFAHVVFDSPPLFGVSDAMVLAPRLEGVILVLRHGRASREAAQRAVAYLAAVHARLLGVILNDVELQAAGTYGYYGYYYAADGHGSGGAEGAAGGGV
ncbi:MAG TPA: polysaccharide biosynthesis tyrosine autokinase [Thermodesulfobacteriota bacterium]|nr:polysaccharide biosynthesis tyrosine autokinase [Thermodesulfobacteriota bacterium]